MDVSTEEREAIAAIAAIQEKQRHKKCVKLRIDKMMFGWVLPMTIGFAGGFAVVYHYYV